MKENETMKATEPIKKVIDLVGEHADCEDCALYDGFGVCIEHGYNLIKQCRDYKKGEL